MRRATRRYIDGIVFRKIKRYWQKMDASGKINDRKTVLCICVAALTVLGVGGFAVLRSTASGFPIHLYLLIAAFFIVMYGWLMRSIASAEKENSAGAMDDGKLARRFLVYKAVKIIAGLFFVLLLVWNNKEIKIPLLLTFLAWYLVTLGLEIYAWMSMEKRLKASKPTVKDEEGKP